MNIINSGLIAGAHTQPKFTWLFLATYADPQALPVVLRTQANTEYEARSQLAGDFSLTFAAKIRTDCPLTCHWMDRDSSVLWSVMGCNAGAALQQMKGDSPQSDKSQLSGGRAK
ncbi:TPA: host cell division inhibitor Icd-like protein [Klebsiella pneumoniae]|uniref:host cell division inhibitor Icd-like protein n=1 Tax=Klebsiella TaxID=570 RepID=UPI00111ADB37|nr:MULTISPECIES: host cell division inhibitor Icd-like protein [Klebsiella]MCJ5546829.1 host cell division inhibitor Icd-like protein [Klebsiella quasipneumoniae]NCB58683.1 host cell division inhibitor Icd-like protein [Gammaproteobacteria bacterium]HEL7929215.1 host cell division inhibitor Icd-like protein [Klebsiella pneumoniae]